MFFGTQCKYHRCIVCAADARSVWVAKFLFMQSISHQLIFTTLGEMTNANKVMKPQHWCDLADIRIRIRINPQSEFESRITSAEVTRLGGSLRSLSAV